jgi:hypothetical protein
MKWNWELRETSGADHLELLMAIKAQKPYGHRKLQVVNHKKDRTEVRGFWD